MHKEPIFHLDLLKHYQVLDRPGTFIVSISYDVTIDNLYTRDDYPRYLVPLRVIKSGDLPQLIKILKDTKVVPFSLVSDFFLTGAIFENDGIDTSTLPIKGEQVVATFEDKDGDLLCTHIKLIDRDDLLYVNFSAIDDLYNLAAKFLLK